MPELRLIAKDENCLSEATCISISEDKDGKQVFVIGLPTVLPDGAPCAVGPGEAAVVIPAAVLDQAVRAKHERDRAQLAFLHEFLALSRSADMWGETLLWYSDGQQIHVSLNVSDVFAWGGSDCEEVTAENLPVLRQAIEDLRAIAKFDVHYAPELFAARVRGMRPQGAAYPKERAATQALFDACGPAREPGFGNPRRVPVPEDWQQAQLEKDHADLQAQQRELRERRRQ